MKSKNYKNWITRFAFYLLSMVILALGITLNAKTSLGVTPIISTAYCVSSLTGYNFGNMTFVLYMLLVCAEIAIHLAGNRKKQIICDGLQVVVSLIFTRFLNVFDRMIPSLTSAGLSKTFAGSLEGRILVLILAITLTGVGAALSLNMRFVPNPGDGIVQTIADATGRENGFVKNCVDILCVVVTCTIGMVFAHHIVGIGLGTLLAMIGVGRVVAVFNRLTRRQTEALFAGSV
jgi:uncharacterized membrane protein YczE